MRVHVSLSAAAVALFVLVAAAFPPATLLAQTDLDAFMKKVIARRDDNWKKLQQYILNERDVVELLGPGQMPIFGQKAEYTWFQRDGFFVKSPTKSNGVTVDDADRKKYEERYLRLERERDRRERERAARGGGSGSTSVSIGSNGVDIRSDSAPSDPQASGDALIAQTRDPQFISSAYFLRFKFEEGKYALVGREKVDGTDTLKIEYYPAKLFSNNTDRNARRIDRGEKLRDDHRESQAIEQAANKVSMVTLWVEPKANQIVKYTFDNVNLDFLPVAWLARVDELTASMQMSQPFAATAPAGDPAREVWLPKNINMRLSLMSALGQFGMRFTADYFDYKLAETSSRIK